MSSAERRCPWALSSPDYLAYHDEEWGVPLRGDAALFERLVLEGFQSGLSWLTILRKRPAFRAAFAGFDVDAIASFGPGDRERLLADAGIVRNRAKVDATLVNARALTALRAAEGDGAFDRLLWSFAPDDDALRAQGFTRPPRVLGDVPARVAQSVALTKELKRRGFVFVGPTTLYALMQATGMVDDHLVGCPASRRDHGSRTRGGARGSRAG